MLTTGVYLWLLPSTEKRSGLLPQVTATSNAIATTDIPRIGQIISNEVELELSPEVLPGASATATSSVTPVVATPIVATPTPKNVYTGTCDSNSPYGFTTINADANLIAIYKDMGVCWLRYQTHAYKMIKENGVYDWSQLDAVVALMNNANIHLDVPLQCLKTPGSSESCFSNPPIPTPDEMASFARAIAERYNGNNGKGYIAAFEIGNEEYDANGSFPIVNYGPILQAGYQAIKEVHPNAIVGMYGTFPSNPVRTTEVLNAIYQGGYGGYMDFMNLHYYNGGLDPRIAVDAGHPSFEQRVQLANSIAIQHGYGGKPIWVTEIGWPIKELPGRVAVTPDVQAEYLVHVTDKASVSGVVRRMFWYTINYGDQPNSIYPPSGPLPAYNALKEYVKNKPVW